jgi:glutamate 5-kinase
VLAGDDLGTLFLPSDDRLASRKHWIAFALRPAGALLPSGIRAVTGSFAAGDPVSVVDPDGREFARGLSTYGAEEIERIRGRRSADIELCLGYKNLDEVIHRDDLVIL